MSSREIRIATRKSALALWQAEYVKARLEQAHPGLKVSLVPMVRRGDKLLDSPLSKMAARACSSRNWKLRCWITKPTSPCIR